jgi:alpha-beta hydrolase superfamily lysophospholipase
MTVRSIPALALVLAIVGCGGAAGSSTSLGPGPGAGGAQPLERRQTIVLRGQLQTLHVYGPPDGAPVIVTSGDGGWIHLAPHVAEMLASKGFLAIGFDAKAYLEGFTRGVTTLRMEDVPRDYEALMAFAAAATRRRPLLVGSSEGAGLSVLAATDAANKEAIAGVVGLGLCNVTELGWRWRDMVIYVTHRPPVEPSFRVTAVVDRLAPVPLAAIHSTHDEYVPLTEIKDVLATARQPKRLWVVDAVNHRFGDNLADFDRSLLAAIAWVDEQRTGQTR